MVVIALPKNFAKHTAIKAVLLKTTIEGMITDMQSKIF
jgi:DNA-binding transcriptional regulator LsrR (DeoR family)